MSTGSLQLYYIIVLSTFLGLRNHQKNEKKLRFQERIPNSIKTSSTVGHTG